MDEAIAYLSETARANFSVSPVETLRGELGIEVSQVKHLADKRNDGGACDGVSFLLDDVILYAPTPNSRRENFTLGHELGHWLIEQSDTLYDWIADQEAPSRLLEMICDRISQRLLLPDSIVTTVVRAAPIRAGHVLDVFDASQASRPVCAIAIAKRLPSVSAVAIIDLATQTVSHVSVSPDLDRGWPAVLPWRGQQVPAGNALLTLNIGQPLTRKMTWTNRWGTTAEFYVDAVNDGGRRVIAVFSDHDLWHAERLHIDIPHDFDDRPKIEIHCCGETRTAWGYPCPTCERPYCPKCKQCHCERISMREKRCSACFLNFQPHLLVNGICGECRE
ncbi:hypothetical protein JXX30_00395 [Rhodococcus erythropolis]|uniref:ImmA/IrrE family metallo-endopeptidase n=1 Tax=Rhodococcus erythropolis TaxID=1833 RepID=UPI00197E867D|nr:hypothetical protein [Rhodococcus erythropolis]QSE41334.1 hypothetical protein JXX30_00395 [Rhodococcus erythropolis]